MSEAFKILPEKIEEMTQQQKRYKSALKYLLNVAKKELEKEELNTESEVLALEIVKVVDDTLNYTFTFK